MKQRGRWYRDKPELVVRRLGGQTIIGRQTRDLQMNDWVLVARNNQEYIAQIQRHQGDLIYYVTTPDNPEPTWLHAKYIVAKIVWPTHFDDKRDITEDR